VFKRQSLTVVGEPKSRSQNLVIKSKRKSLQKSAPQRWKEGGGGGKKDGQRYRLGDGGGVEGSGAHADGGAPVHVKCLGQRRTACGDGGHGPADGFAGGGVIVAEGKLFDGEGGVVGPPAGASVSEAVTW